MPFIFYTGIGTHNNRQIYTADEFFEMMDSIFHAGGQYSEDQLDFENCVLPRDFQTFDLQQWVRYSGAMLISNEVLRVLDDSVASQ